MPISLKARTSYIPSGRYNEQRLSQGLIPGTDRNLALKIRGKVKFLTEAGKSINRTLLILNDLAEREGFEPPIALRLCLISSQVHSTGLCHLSALSHSNTDCFNRMSPASAKMQQISSHAEQLNYCADTRYMTEPCGGTVASISPCDVVIDFDTRFLSFSEETFLNPTRTAVVLIFF